MKNFTPNYQNMVDAEHNRTAKRISLYEHLVDNAFMVIYLGKLFESVGNIVLEIWDRLLIRFGDQIYITQENYLAMNKAIHIARGEMI